MSFVASNISFFGPRQVPGLALWLDASDATTIGLSSNTQNVTQWRDKSGRNNNATPFGTGSPTYSSNSIVFTGTQAFGTTLSSLMSNQSGFAIVRYSSAAKINILSVNRISGTAAIQQIIQNNVQSLTTYGATLIVSGATLTQNTMLLYNHTFSATCNAFIYLNGSQRGTSTGPYTFTGAGTINIGGYDTTPGEGFIGSMNEIILYSNVLTTLQRQQIEGHLAWKWGLQANLPAGHPYRFNSQQAIYPFTLLRTIPQPKINVPSWTLFNPLSIASCSLWLDSSSSNNFTLSNTSNVVQWNDKSGNGRNFITIAGSPRFVSPSQGVFFNGVTADCMQSSSNSMQPSSNISYTAGITSLFVVTKITGINSGHAYIVVFGNGTDFSLRYSQGGTGNNNDIFNTRSLFYNGTTSSNIFSIPVAAFSNTSLINGVVNITNSTVIQLSLGPESIGRPHSNRYLTGFINEVLIYNIPLTGQQRQQVEGYLTYKWNIQPRLDVSHPAKTNFLYPVLPSIPTGVSVPNKITITSRFTPRSLSGLSLWLDAADSATVLNPGTSNMVWVDKSGTGKNAIVSPSNAQLNFFGTFPTYCNAGNIPTSIQFNCNVMYSKSNIGVAESTFFIVLQNILPYTGSRAVFSIAASRNQPYNSIDAFEVGMNLGSSPITPSVAYGLTQGTYTPINFATQTVPNLSTNNYPFSMLSFTETNTATINTFTNGSLARSATNSGSRSNTGTGYAICGEWTAGNGGIAATNMGTFNISEIILYSNVLNTRQRQNVEGYLSWKWGLRSSLPSTHQNVFIPP